MKKSNFPSNPMKAIRVLDPSKTYFTSDSHWGHKNILKFCGRPFKDVREMNQALVDNWNAVVPEDADVWHLGDFCFGGSADWKHLVGCLHGTIHLVMGNHDKVASDSMLGFFESVHPGLAHLSIEDSDIWLSHFPLLCFSGANRGAWNLFGHIHTQKPDTDNSGSLDAPRSRYLYPTQYDVGVDQNNYRPISYREVYDIIQKQKLKNES